MSRYRRHRHPVATALAVIIGWPLIGAAFLVYLLAAITAEVVILIAGKHR